MPNQRENRDHSLALLHEARRILAEVHNDPSTVAPEHVKLYEAIHHIDRALADWNTITLELESRNA